MHPRRHRARPSVGGLRRHVAASALCIVLAGCATMRPPGTSEELDSDPLEPANRVVFDFNMKMDDWVIAPAARAYRAIFPSFVRDRLRGFVDNLAEPRIFVNDLLQGRGDAAGTTFARFFINTTAGFAGFFDQATPAGYTRQTGDFGQTLYVWGVADTPYLVLPFFGPSNVRDAFGLGVDLVTTPPTPFLFGPSAQGVEWGLTIADGIDLRERNLEIVDEIRKSALDLYTHYRSLWLQHRRAELREARGQTQAPEELVDPEAPKP